MLFAERAQTRSPSSSPWNGAQGSFPQGAYSINKCLLGWLGNNLAKPLCDQTQGFSEEEQTRTPGNLTSPNSQLSSGKQGNTWVIFFLLSWKTPRSLHLVLTQDNVWWNFNTKIVPILHPASSVYWRVPFLYQNWFLRMSTGITGRRPHDSSAGLCVRSAKYQRECAGIVT